MAVPGIYPAVPPIQQLHPAVPMLLLHLAVPPIQQLHPAVPMLRGLENENLSRTLVWGQSLSRGFIAVYLPFVANCRYCLSQKGKYSVHLALRLSKNAVN